jgi:hypothetical protein
VSLVCSAICGCNVAPSISYTSCECDRRNDSSTFLPFLGVGQTSHFVCETYYIISRTLPRRSGHSKTLQWHFPRSASPDPAAPRPSFSPQPTDAPALSLDQNTPTPEEASVADGSVSSAVGKEHAPIEGYWDPRLGLLSSYEKHSGLEFTLHEGW